MNERVPEFGVIVHLMKRYLEHLAGKHNQKSHGNKYGSADAIKGNVKRLGKDKEALKRMAARARGDKDFQAEVKKNSKFTIPRTDYEGGSEKLNDFKDAEGKSVPGLARKYGSLVLVTRKTGSNQYAKIYTANGYRVPVMPQTRINGKVKQVQKTIEELAKMADWVKLSRVQSQSKDAQDFAQKSYQIVRDNLGE